MPGGGGSSTTIQKADPWSGVQPYLTDQYATVNALANSGILPYYPGETYAPFNPLQIGGQYATLDYSQNRFQPGVGTLQTQLAQNINQQLDPSRTNPYQGHFQAMFDAPAQVANNPYLNQMMQRNADNVQTDLLRNVMPSIRSNAAMAGQYGGSRQGIAEGIAIGDAARGLADSNAQMQMNAWNTGMGQRTSAGQLMGQGFANQLQASNQAMSQMPAALQLGFMGPQQAMNIGQMQQDQYNRSIQEKMARYYYPEQVAWERQGQLANILSGAQPYASQTTQGPGSNPLATAMGLGSLGIGAYGAGLFGGAGAGAAGSIIGSSALGSGTAMASMWPAFAMASDRRLKQNITPLGERGGYQWYKFEYKDPDTYGHGKQIGVMADEVEKIKPEAVITMPSGYKAVNYGVL